MAAMATFGLAVLSSSLNSKWEKRPSDAGWIGTRIGACHTGANRLCCQ
jgi:hypothetical protein